MVRSAAMPIPIGLELWTVRTDLKRDMMATLGAVAGLGYESVEFFSTYLDWTLDDARAVRRRLDDLGLTCASTHNGMRAFTAEAFAKTVALNQILGSPFVVVASIPPVASLDGWRQAADAFSDVADRLRPHGLAAGFHNHQREWTPIDGELPIEVVAGRTPRDFILQLDVGPAVEHGIDVVTWIQAHPGRVRSIHLRDWSATRGYHIAFGEGDCPWPAICAAAETAGGIESYLVENGHSTPDEEFDIARRSLANWRRLRAVESRPSGT
jgi:sugar phosphate isomerase/epimerase